MCFIIKYIKHSICVLALMLAIIHCIKQKIFISIMNFQKIVNVFFKEDPFQKQLKKIGLFTDDLQHQSLLKGLQLFRKKIVSKTQQAFLKALIQSLQNQTSMIKKFKALSLLLQISKQSKYDIADIVMNKKLKVFTKSAKPKAIPPLCKATLELYVPGSLLVPIFNYLMKLSMNEQLYNTCLSHQIPQDEIFRRGTKIRFIWIFKIYNLVNILIPVVDTLCKFLIQFPNYQFLKQISKTLYDDILIMNNFVVLALQEAASDNYMLMPYFDMLQFHESMMEQRTTIYKIDALFLGLQKFIKNLQKPKRLYLSDDQISEIQVQALRVKLISNSLKNPKKDHTRLETQYNVKVHLTQQNFQKKLKRNITQGNRLQVTEQDQKNFKQKYRNLDLGKHVSFQQQEECQQDQNQQQQNYQNIKQQNYQNIKAQQIKQVEESIKNELKYQK